MKRILTIIAMVFAILSAFAQSQPGNNLGKSLLTMKQEFPELRYLRTDEKGDFYEECMICESTDGFSKMWYDSMWESFASKYAYAVVENTYHSKKFRFRGFVINLIFYAENGKNTALIVYQKD
jgi:hypothetical protein